LIDIGFGFSLDFGFQKNLLDGFRILVLIEFNQSTSDTKLLT